ncbi:MAG: helix-turn-helix domain-containing protein, partial [Bacillota bacterium]|nr:helix-turn-helix domain-containing protein [Bacillota bacterium]
TSPKVLTANLRQLEEWGLVSRTVFPEVPIRVEYSLTDLGLTLKPVFSAMAKWGKSYKNTLTY